MCLAIPARIVLKRDDGTADVELEGVTKEISLDLVPEAKVGDYVVVHVGFALSLLQEDEAKRTLALFANAGAAA